MSTSRGAWSVAGLVAGFAGLAASYCVAMVTTIRDPPVVAVAELVIRLTPGPVVERAIQILGHRDKPVLMLGILVLCGRAVRVGRPTGPAHLVGADDRVRRARRARRHRGLVAARRDHARPAPGGGRVRHLAGLPLPAHRAAAPPRARGRGGRARPRGERPRAPGPHPPYVPAPGRRDGRRRRRPRRGRPRGRPRPPTRRGDPAAAAAARASPRRRCRRASASTCRG